jgi:hypothetical protein
MLHGTSNPQPCHGIYISHLLPVDYSKQDVELSSYNGLNSSDTEGDSSAQMTPQKCS